MHTRHGPRFVELQIHRLRTSGLSSQFSTYNLKGEHFFGQRDRYSGSPSRKEVNPLSLAGEFGGSSRGIASKEMMVIVQYAPLNFLALTITTRNIVVALPHILLSTNTHPKATITFL